MVIMVGYVGSNSKYFQNNALIRVTNLFTHAVTPQLDFLADY